MPRVTSRQNPLIARCRRLAGGRTAGDAAALLDRPHLLASALDAGVSIAGVCLFPGI